MDALSSSSPPPPPRSPPTISLGLSRNLRPVFATSAAAASSSPRVPVLLQALPNGSLSQCGAGADAHSPDFSLPNNFQLFLFS
ncbi:hypothetical protein FCM35_KLT02653 [Carex littledalei]|uniref:Uncharacterized protein n=1 Tax=Carex littledalei TaxID=544730 RepID=A0A833R4G2_9POAL|nr:hypothetical protein FCM35_KLT02653 [Carex littledalei]